MQTPESNGHTSSLLQKPSFEKFFRIRNFNPDAQDIQIMGELAQFPKNTIIANLHNFFSSEKENSEVALENLIASHNEQINETDNQKLKNTLEENIKVFNLFLQFCKKYGWDTSWGLVVALEEN